MTYRRVNASLILLAVLLCFVAAPAAEAQRIYNRQTGTIKNQSTPLTPGHCAVVDANGNDVSTQACPGGGNITTDAGATREVDHLDLQQMRDRAASAGSPGKELP